MRHSAVRGLAFLLLFCGLFPCLPGIANAQDNAEETHAPPKITLQLDTDIRQALAQIFMAMGVSYSITPSVKEERVLCSFKETPARIALESVLRNASQPLTYRFNDNVYTVLPRFEAPPTVAWHGKVVLRLHKKGRVDPMVLDLRGSARCDQTIHLEGRIEGFIEARGLQASHIKLSIRPCADWKTGGELWEADGRVDLTWKPQGEKRPLRWYQSFKGLVYDQEDANSKGRGRPLTSMTFQAKDSKLPLLAVEIYLLPSILSQTIGIQ